MSNALAARFADHPVMVAAGHENWLSNCIESLQAKIDAATPEQAQALAVTANADDKEWWGEEGSMLAFLRPYKVQNGVLQVPVKGMLLHGFPFAAFGMATGYDYIVKAFERGMADPEVQSIAMIVNSGGGEVAGNFDAVDRLYQMRGAKPMVALVNEHAYSAAYSLASAMDRIVIPRTGGVGSVGVLTSHIDRSKQLENSGLKVTFIHAGKHKVDGNPMEPISEEVRSRMQARIDGLYNIFTATVARNLGVSEQTVRGTEAQVYSAEESITLGFAHSVQAFDAALAALGGRPPEATGVETMSQPNQPTTGASQTELDAARAEGEQAGALAERTRIQGILNAEEAKDKGGLASHLSMSTDLSVEAAVSILKAAPVEASAPKPEPTRAASAFEQAMAHGNPNIPAEAGDGGDPQAQGAEDLSASILADYRRDTGHAVKAK